MQLMSVNGSRRMNSAPKMSGIWGQASVYGERTPQWARTTLRDLTGHLFDLHLPRHQQRADLHVRRRMQPANTLNRLRTALPKVSQQRRNELAVQLLAVTRADRSADRIA